MAGIFNSSAEFIVRILRLFADSELLIALITAISTAGGTVILQKRRERKKIINSIIGEIRGNQSKASRIVDNVFTDAGSRNQIQRPDHLGRVTKLKTTCYENAVQSGVLTSLPKSLQNSIFNHYDTVENINRQIDLRDKIRESTDEEFDFTLKMISSDFGILLSTTSLMSDKGRIYEVKKKLKDFEMADRNQPTKEEMISSIENFQENADSKDYKFDNLEEEISKALTRFPSFKK